jgi:pyrroloquinoline quinone (PQQ) biosynthesis protein C
MSRPAFPQLLDEVLADRRLLSHPFYVRWEAGALTTGELSAYAAQYRHFERLLPQVLEQAWTALTDGQAKQMVRANLDDELGVPAPHVELFEAFAAAVGAGEEAPTPATAALVEHYRGAPRRGPAALVSALAAYEVQSADIARSKADGLQARYGLSQAQTRFWDVHASMDADHGAWTMETLAAMDADAASVRAEARAAADAWWSFLDERQEAAPQLVGA